MIDPEISDLIVKYRNICGTPKDGVILIGKNGPKTTMVKTILDMLESEKKRRKKRERKRRQRERKRIRNSS